VDDINLVVVSFGTTISKSVRNIEFEGNNEMYLSQDIVKLINIIETCYVSRENNKYSYYKISQKACGGDQG